MVFKVIDGNLTSIFNKTQNIANGFNIASNSINSYANAFNRLNTQQNFGARWDTFLSGMDKASPKLATYFQDLAKQGASARASIQDMYTVLLDGNTRGIGNVKSIISAFNQVNPANQQAFAQAVGQTNAQLGIYLSNLNGAKASMSGYTGSLVATTAKTIALKTASMILNGALSAVVSLIIGGAISAVTKLVNAQQLAIDKANEAAQSVKEQEETIDEYIDKIIELRRNLEDENTSQQEAIDIRKELFEIQDAIIEKYALEADSIDLVNGKINDQVNALYELKKAEYKEQYSLNKEGYDAARAKIAEQTIVVNKQRARATYYSLDGDIKKFRSYVYDLFLNQGFTVDDQGVEFEMTSDIYTIDNALKQIYNDILEYSKNGSEDVKNEANAALTYISNIRRDWSNDIITENEELFSQWVKYGDEYGNTYLDLVRKQSNLEYAIKTGNAEDIEKAKTEFAETYNKVSEDAIKKGDSDVARYFEKIFGDTVDSLDDTSDSLESVKESSDNTITSITSLTDAFSKLKEALEDIINYADTYQSAMQKISAGTGLTTDEVLKLLEIDPSLFDKFIKQKDGTWTIPIEFLIDSHDSVVVNNGKVKDTIKQYQSEYDNAVKELEQYTAERNNLVVNDAVTRAAASDLDKKIAETEKKIESAQKNINLASFYESVLDYSDADRIRDSYDEVVKKIDEYNDGISSLNKAIDTINEGNSLSYDEMTQLIELYPELEGKVIETANGYTIEVNALEDVRTQSYKTRNDYIDDRTAEVAALREDVKQQIEEYKRLAIARIVSENSHGNYIATTDELLENDPEYQALLLKLELYDEYFNKVVGYKRTVTGNDNSGSSNKSVSNSLQNQIDYYKILLEAIGIVSDKAVESLEKEKDAIDQKIDALNDEKDALQEKNDEQQRELDLIEAKNNLDKAKKQKVFVYKEGQGLVQVQDEKAVADAQKEYDDIQNEIKQAEIDKQIDALEKQNEALDKQIDGWNEYKDQFSNMENDIKDTLTVEQAKKALGTDEKGLLSLDDKTINGICNGLATAIYNKDVEDNKENSKYVTVKLEDYLKSVGATVTPTEFKAMASTITNNPANIVPATNANSTVNNAQTINNKTANFNATFNIYDALDPHKIIDTVKEYFNGVLKQTINSVK